MYEAGGCIGCPPHICGIPKSKKCGTGWKRPISYRLYEMSTGNTARSSGGAFKTTFLPCVLSMTRVCVCMPC